MAPLEKTSSSTIRIFWVFIFLPFSEWKGTGRRNLPAPCSSLPAAHGAHHAHSWTKASGAEACPRAKSRALVESRQLSQLLWCEHLPDLEPEISGLLLELRLEIEHLFLLCCNCSLVRIWTRPEAPKFCSLCVKLFLERFDLFQKALPQSLALSGLLRCEVLDGRDAVRRSSKTPTEPGSEAGTPGQSNSSHQCHH